MPLLLLLLTISLYAVEPTWANHRNEYRTPVTEFYHRYRVMNVLEDKFKLWISTSTSNTELRKKYLKDYMTTYDRSFNKTDEWIFATFMDDVTLLEIVESIGKDYNGIKSLFANVTLVYKIAYMQRVRVAMERGEKDYAAILKLCKQREIELAERLEAKLMEISTVEWKRQFQFDVREFLMQNKMSKTVHFDLRDFLDKKYPFRQWLVLIHHAHVNNWACGKGFPYVFPQIFPNRDVIVAQVERSVEANRARQALWMGKISDDRYDLFCKRRSKAIVEEAITNRCHTIDAPLLGAFAFDKKTGPPVLAASKKGMLATKVVRRGSLVLCEQYYSVVVFG